MSTTPLLNAADAVENVIRAGAGAGEKTAVKNICAGERPRAHELPAAFGNDKKIWALTHEGRRARELAAEAAAENVTRASASEKPAVKNICAGERPRAHELPAAFGNDEKIWALTHEGRRARELAAAAAAENVTRAGASEKPAVKNICAGVRPAAFGNDEKIWALTHEGRRARELAAAAAAENVIRAGASEKPAGENTCAGERLRAHELPAAFGNRLGAGEMTWAHAREGRRAREHEAEPGKSNLQHAGGGNPPTEPKKVATVPRTLGALATTSSQPRQMPISDAVIGKRHVLYAMALAAPPALLASAAGLKLFPGDWAWVAGAGAAVWILATGGMMLNQFGMMGWEHVLGGHLGRLGVFGAVILMSFYAYRAYFPSSDIGLFFLLFLAMLSVGGPWIISCFRPDDASPATTSETVSTDEIV